MTTPAWQAGTLYPTGSLVQPVSGLPPSDTTLDNPGFESGDVDWTKGAEWAITNTPPYNGAYAGTWCAYFHHVAAGAYSSDITQTVAVAVAPGKSITAWAFANLDGPDDVSIALGLKWYTAADVLISESVGTAFEHEDGAGWRQISVTGVAPATAAKVKLFARASGTDDSPNPEVRLDAVTWNYLTAAIPAGLVFQAVQPAVGTSASEEPTWPSVLGNTVVDNTVTWEAVQASRVEWTAEPIAESGTVEPTWPGTPGEFVLDGTVSWECISRRITDEKCPNGTVVYLLASHVFSDDDDIIRFSAPNNPKDWSSQHRAGFLPFGVQGGGSNPVTAMGEYRGNLIPLNSEMLQNWQVDPDPSLMALADKKKGLGSTFPRAVVAFGDETALLTERGIRTVTVAAGTDNQATGQDLGEPVDSRVAELLEAAKDAFFVDGQSDATADRYPGTAHSVCATYYPAAGQAWFCFPSANARDNAWTVPVTPPSAANVLCGAFTGADARNAAGTRVRFVGSWFFGLENGNYWGAFLGPNVANSSISTGNIASFGSDDILAACYGEDAAGNGRIVAAGEGGKLSTTTAFLSPASWSWTARTSGFGASTIRCAAYGEGVFMTGGMSGKLATSPDAITWTLRTTGFASGASDGVLVLFFDDQAGRWYGGGTGGQLRYSDDDGASWRAVTSGLTGDVKAITRVGDWLNVFTATEAVTARVDELGDWFEIARWHGTTEVYCAAASNLDDRLVIVRKDATTFDAATGTDPTYYDTSLATEHTLWDGGESYWTDTTGTVGTASQHPRALIPGLGFFVLVGDAGLLKAIRYDGACTALVCSLNRGGAKWSEYAFPFAIEAPAQLGNVLYVRSGDFIRQIDEDSVTDATVYFDSNLEVPFDGVVQWAPLDLGAPGREKRLEGFDIVAEGAPNVQIGYDARDLTVLTTSYEVDPDTVPGGIIPLSVIAPTLAPKITFTGGERWSLSSFLLHVHGGRTR